MPRNEALRMYVSHGFRKINSQILPFHTDIIRISTRLWLMIWKTLKTVVDFYQNQKNKNRNAFCDFTFEKRYYAETIDWHTLQSFYFLPDKNNYIHKDRCNVDSTEISQEKRRKTHSHFPKTIKNCE